MQRTVIEKRYIIPQGALASAGFTAAQTKRVSQCEAISLADPVLGPRNYDMHQLFPDQTDALEDDGRVLSVVQERLRRELKQKNVMWTRHRKLPEFIFCLQCRMPLEVRQCRKADDRSIALLTERKRIGKLIDHALMFSSVKRVEDVPSDELLPYASEDDDASTTDDQDLKRPITMAMHEVIVETIKAEYEKLVEDLRQQNSTKSNELDSFRLQVASLNEDLMVARINENQAISDRKHFEGKFAESLKEIKKQDEKIRGLTFEVNNWQVKYDTHLKRSFGFFANLQKKHDLALCYERWETMHMNFQLDKNKAEYEAKRRDEIEKLRMEVSRVQNATSYLTEKLNKHVQFRTDKAKEKLGSQELGSARFCFRFWRRNLQRIKAENEAQKLATEKHAAEQKFHLCYVQVKALKKEEMRLNELVKELMSRASARELDIVELVKSHQRFVFYLNREHDEKLRKVVHTCATHWSRKLRARVISELLRRFANNLRHSTRVASLQAFLFEENREIKFHEDDPIPYRARLRVVSRGNGRMCEACERQIIFYSRPQTGGSTRPQTREDGVFRLSYAPDDQRGPSQEWRHP